MDRISCLSSFNLWTLIRPLLAELSDFEEMDRFAFDHRYLSDQWLHRELKVGFKNLNKFSTRIVHRFFEKKFFPFLT